MKNGVYFSQNEDGKRRACKYQEPVTYALVLLPDKNIPLRTLLEVMRLFVRLTEQEALAIAVDLYGYHHAVSCGSYPFDIALTKKQQMASYLAAKGHRFMCEVRAQNA